MDLSETAELKPYVRKRCVSRFRKNGKLIDRSAIARWAHSHELCCCEVGCSQEHRSALDIVGDERAELS